MPSKTTHGQHEKLRCLDLFSGVGGFSLALRHVCNTVAYCDVDKASQEVLRARMTSSTGLHLDAAPVFEDVTKISRQDLHRIKPHIITGGFPCQDISCMQRKSDALGIYGPRSRLFFEIPRLIRESPSIKHVFLENSPCIYDRGLDRVLQELATAGLTHVVYGVFPATDVGALHSRKRWFCLASRDPVSIPIMPAAQLRDATSFEWGRERTPRLVPRPRDQAGMRKLQDRYALLGNSVVPQCVAYAFHTLSLALRGLVSGKIQRVGNNMPLIRSLDAYVMDRVNNRVIAGVRAAALSQMQSEQFRIESPLPQGVDLPRSRKTAGTERTLVLRDDHGTEIRKSLWPTPRRSVWGQCRVLSNRCSWDLGTFIFYEVGSKCPTSPSISERSKHCAINPRFIEFLMGFPSDWTKSE